MAYLSFSSSRVLIHRALISCALCVSSLAIAADLQPAITAFNELHYSDAKPLFEAAVKDVGSRNDALYYLGRIAFEEGDAEKAKGFLEQSVNLVPNTSDEYYWFGRAYAELAQRANILKQASYAFNVHKYFQLAVDTDSKSVEAQRGLFAFYIMAPSIMGGGVDKAEKALNDIRLLSPVDADIKQLDIFAKKEDVDKSLVQAKFLVTTYPLSAEALFRAAHVLREQKKLEDAIVSFEAASKLPVTPHNRVFVEASLLHFGETCQWANARLDEAIESLEKYLAIKAGTKNIELNGPRWTLAMLYRQKGNMEKYRNLRKQLDPAFIKQHKWIKEQVEKFDVQDKKA